LNDDDRTYIGDPNPDVIYGGSISLAYKGLDLLLFFQGVAGNDLYVNTKSLLRGTSATNLMAELYTDGWRNPGDKTDIPAISRKDNNNNMRRSSWWVQDGSFCKIKTLQIGYSLPAKWLQKTKVFQGVRLYANTENLFTFTKFQYMDPEVPNGNPLNLGIENLGYPNPRSITFGLNVQF
jgi:hypothetical protein